MSQVGQLLLSTLTTLKHAGAAFAARDALQLIASSCMSPKKPMELRGLPQEWSRRLLEEISLKERVRNSTLRRSTGYALGFMAIMRAEVLTSKANSALMSKSILLKLLTFSLPPSERIEQTFSRLKLATIEHSSISNAQYEVRLRKDLLYLLLFTYFHIHSTFVAHKDKMQNTRIKHTSDVNSRCSSLRSHQSNCW
jgi:hypothetical protein